MAGYENIQPLLGLGEEIFTRPPGVSPVGANVFDGRSLLAAAVMKPENILVLRQAL
jgi:hypothetical protein